MANGVRFPIRRKLLLLMSGLVLAATGVYLAMAIGLFTEDKAFIVQELNARAVKSLAALVDAKFDKIVDKIQLLTSSAPHDEAWTRAILEAEPDLISLALYSPSDPAAPPLFTVKNSGYLKLYGLSIENLDRVRQEVPIPFGKVLSRGTWVANATVSGGAPLLTLAVVVQLADGGRKEERVAVADIRLDSFLRVLKDEGLATVYLVDSEGGVLAHPDSALISRRASLLDIPIVREAFEGGGGRQATPFVWKSERWWGAWATSRIGGLRAVSQVAEADAFRPVTRLIRKSIGFALLILTLGVLLSAWLARAFNAMANDLQEKGKSNISPE